MIVLDGLEDSFDNDRAESMLALHLGEITFSSELVRKSMYDFDLDTPAGIEKLMALLPIMDPEILKDIMTEIWPGYPTDIDARRHRLEIKGYLKDYLDAYEQGDELEENPEAPTDPTGVGGAGGPPEAPQDGTPQQTPVANPPGA